MNTKTRRKLLIAMMALTLCWAPAGMTRAAETTAAETAAVETTAAAETPAAAETTAAAEVTGWFVAGTTELKAEANADAEKLADLTPNTEVELVEAGNPEEEGSYAKIRVADQEGFIPAALLAEHPVRFTTGNLTLRAEANKESEKLAIVPLGSTVPVLELGDPAVEDGYSKVQFEDKEGYVLTKYLTENQEEAIQAQKEAEAEEKAQAAAEKKSSKKKSSKKSKKSKKKSSGKKKEVSRKKYDDCDGSGHGYYEITYSDGSTKIVEY